MASSSFRFRAVSPVSLGWIVLLAAALHCAPVERPSGNVGDWLVIPIPKDPGSLNFITARDRMSKQVARLVADSLVDHNEKMEMVPRLATSWEVSEDQTTITFHLREGVRWHDGAPFTADDVLFTYEKIIDPAWGAVSKISQFKEVKRIETPDPLTVRVIYRTPYAPGLLAWETPIIPKHIFENEEIGTSPHNRSPIGTGPYRFQSWKTAQEIVLVANSDYWGDPPDIQRIVFKVIPSKNTLYRSLLAGEVDLATLRPEDWNALGKRPDADRFRLLKYSTLQLAQIAWNGDGSFPAFSDPRVRRAMTLLIDRQTYLEKVRLGFGEVASSLFPANMLGHDPDLAPLPFDPGEAETILDEAGWRIDPDRGLRIKDGTPFRFQLTTVSGIEWQETFAAFLQESLRKAGIRMEIRRMEWNSFLSTRDRGHYQAALGIWTLDLDPDGAYQVLHSSMVPGSNIVSYRNPEVDRLLEKGRRELNAPNRDRIYREIGVLLAADQPYTLLFFFAAPLAIDARFENVKVSPLGLFLWYPANLEWRVPEQKQKYGPAGIIHGR
ncbi:MAG: peptide-binding protein [Acidobacteria bacterium]|nr:peptide-binding protein [Acidobacteriota bacterium]